MTVLWKVQFSADILSRITELIFTHRWFHNKMHNFSVAVAQIKTPNNTSRCRSIQRTWGRSPDFWPRQECQLTGWSSSPLHLFMSLPGKKSASWKVASIHIYCSPKLYPTHVPGFQAPGWFSWSLSGCSLNRLNSVAGQYAQACVQAAAQCGTDVLDLWSLMQKDDQVSRYITAWRGKNVLIPAHF